MAKCLIRLANAIRPNRANAIFKMRNAGWGDGVASGFLPLGPFLSDRSRFCAKKHVCNIAQSKRRLVDKL